MTIEVKRIGADSSEMSIHTSAIGDRRWCCQRIQAMDWRRLGNSAIGLPDNTAALAIQANDPPQYSGFWKEIIGRGDEHRSSQEDRERANRRWPAWHHRHVSPESKEIQKKPQATYEHERSKRLELPGP
jgi:hypothetical protein